MSFYTALRFYRPCPPPKLTGADLAAFVSAFSTLGMADETGSLGYSIKLGKAIGQDDRPSDWYEPIPGTGGMISVPCEIEYDAEGSELSSLAQLAGELANVRGTIYRANLSLGSLENAMFQVMTRKPSEENEQSLALQSWCLEIGPITTCDLGSEGVYMVGWIGVGLHGPGYLYPWSFRDLIDRAEALAPMRALQELCRNTWPVSPQKLPRSVVKARREMGDLWPYPDLHQPWDWYWGLSEG